MSTPNTNSEALLSDIQALNLVAPQLSRGQHQQQQQQQQQQKQQQKARPGQGSGLDHFERLKQEFLLANPNAHTTNQLLPRSAVTDEQVAAGIDGGAREEYDEEELASIFRLALGGEDEDEEEDDGSVQAPPGLFGARTQQPQMQAPPQPRPQQHARPPSYPSSVYPQPSGYQLQAPPPVMAPQGVHGSPPRHMMAPHGVQAPPPRHMMAPDVARGPLPPQMMARGPTVPQMPMGPRQGPYSFDLFDGVDGESFGGMGRIRMGDSRRMKGREIFNLIRIHKSAGKTGDDFSDDYYFFKCTELKQQEAMGYTKVDSAISAESISSSTKANRPAKLLAEMMTLHKEGVSAIKSTEIQAPTLRALPELPGSTFRAPSYFEVVRDKAAKEWHETNSVLGRTDRSNLKTPKTLLAMDPSEIDAQDTNTNESKSNNGFPTFQTPHWKLRKRVGEVANTLLEIEDMDRLLRAKVNALAKFGDGDSSLSAKEMIQKLETKQVQLCDRLGTFLGMSSISKGVPITVDEVQLRGVLWMPKGRKLVCRATGALLPMHHETLILTMARMLVFFVCMSPDGMDSDDPLERDNAEMDIYCAKAMCAEVASLELKLVTKCLISLLDSQSPDTLRAILATPGGAELCRGILMHGQTLAEKQGHIGDPENLVSEWAAQFARFIEMAEQGIQGHGQE